MFRTGILAAALLSTVILAACSPRADLGSTDGAGPDASGDAFANVAGPDASGDAFAIVAGPDASGDAFANVVTTLDVLPGGTFTFMVDRSWPGRVENGSAVSFPSDPIPASEYDPAPAEAYYTVVFAADAGSLSLTLVNAPDAGDRPYSATKASTSASEWRYDLSDATAGGRFVLAGASGALDVELTVYGSGVPVVRSMRGYLTRP